MKNNKEKKGKGSQKILQLKSIEKLREDKQKMLNILHRKEIKLFYVLKLPICGGFMQIHSGSSFPSSQCYN